jgi:flavin-dependent dehydrogenase
MATENADVVIVGGGPAGSSCAWKLRRSGLSVIVLDKASFPRNKICAGWITPGVLRALAIDPEQYAAGPRVLQPITAFQTSVMGNAEVLTRYVRPVSYGIRRCEFDTYLLQRSGAQLRCGAVGERLERKAGRWIVNDRFSAPFLVGAGGHFCPVARLLNPGLREEVVAAQEIEFPLNDMQQSRCLVDAQAPELYICHDLKGYGWCVRKGHYLNVGFGRQDRHDFPHQARGFLKFLIAGRRIPSDLPTKLAGHAYLLYGSTARRVCDEGVILIGDAAGIAYTQSGEGIRPAIESGLLAADAIVAANRGEQPLGRYLRSLESRFGRRRSRSIGLSEGLVTWLAPRLLGSRWFTRHVVLDRWFLHAHQQAIYEPRNVCS